MTDSHLFLCGLGPPPVLVHDHGRGPGVDLPGEGGVVPHHDGDGPEEDALVGAVAVEAVPRGGEHEFAPVVGVNLTHTKLSLILFFFF